MSNVWRVLLAAASISVLGAATVHAAPREEGGPLLGLWEWITTAAPFGFEIGGMTGTPPLDPQAAGCGMDPNGGGSCGRGGGPPGGKTDPRDGGEG